MNYVLSLLVLMSALFVGCRVSDIREMTVKVPSMASESDVQKVRAALTPLTGVDKEKTVFDVKGRTVKVCYDSMQIAHKNIEIAIAEAGYNANEIPAIRNAAAK